MALDPIAVNASAERALAPDTVDLTAINLAAGATYAFIVGGADHGETLPDPVIGVFSSDLSQLLAVQDDSPYSLDPVLDFTPVTSGTYVVAVTDITGLGDTYSIAVFQVDPNPPERPHINFGDAKSG